MDTSKNTALRVIAIFKLVKSLLLILVGISVLKMVHGDAVATMTRWITEAGINPDSHYVEQALGKLSHLPPGKFKELGVASFIYSGLFLTEGTGLWLRKRWAEWFTVFITGSLVPFEGYELHHHPTVGKLVMLAINIAVVAYLLVRLRKKD